MDHFRRTRWSALFLHKVNFLVKEFFMKIYFACSITGGRQDEERYRQIVTALEAEGHKVPTASLASAAGMVLEKNFDPKYVYQRDTNWIKECDLIIAEISTPSHGVGYEIGYALQNRKPVLCLFQANVSVSKMITGNPDGRLVTYPYQDISDALQFVKSYLLEIHNG